MDRRKATLRAAGAIATLVALLTLLPSGTAQPVMRCNGLNQADCEAAADAVLAAIADQGSPGVAALQVAAPAYCTLTMGGPASCLSGDATAGVDFRSGATARYRVYRATTWHGLAIPARAVHASGY